MKTIPELLYKAHPAIIHFMIVGFLLAAGASIVRLIGLLKYDKFAKSYNNKFLRNFSQLNFYIAVIDFPIIVYTGFNDANGIQNALKIDILRFKILLAITIASIVVVREIYAYIIEPELLENNIRITLVDTAFLSTIASLTIVIAGAGGRYVFGHSVLDNVGLGWLIPRHFSQSFLSQNIVFNISIAILSFLLVIYLLLRVPFTISRAEIRHTLHLPTSTH